MKNQFSWRQYRYPAFALLVTLFLLILHSSYSVKSSSALDAKTQTVTITESGFLPNQLAFAKGDTVILTVVNADNTPHNFVIEDLHVATTPIAAGQSSSITFTFEKQGTFTYLSNTPGYPEIGLRGTLTIK